MSDLDKEEENPDSVTLMTIHSSKGLEFDHVFIVGMEENLFPSTLSLASRSELEEERRLFYVAITRAKQSVFLSCANMRYKYGQVIFSEKSRFINDIDPEYLQSSCEKKPPLPFSQRAAMPKRPLPKEKRKPLPLASVRRNVITKHSEAPTAWEDLPSQDCKEGMRVYHDKFGAGLVKSVEGSGADTKALVDFDEHGIKTLILRFAKLKKITQ